MTITIVLQKAILLLIAIIPFCNDVSAQKADSSLMELPGKLLSQVEKKSIHVSSQIDRQTDKYLKRFLDREKKLQKKVSRKDSLLAKQLFEGVEAKYKKLKGSVAGNDSKLYSGHLDSITTAFKFFDGKKTIEGYDGVAGTYGDLQSRFNKTEEIKAFIAERNKLLKENLQKIGLVKQLKSFQKDAYYYTAQVKELKRTFEDPSKLEKKLMELAMLHPDFKAFFTKNSQLSNLFNPGGSSATSTVSLAGLQSRVFINQNLRDRFGSGPDVTSQLHSNLVDAQAQLNELKNKALKLGDGSIGNGDADLPKNFKPNSQKTKSVFQRLEYGTNIQSQKAGRFFPVTSDIGLSLGYKLHDNSSIGVGMSYKIGFGNGFKNFKLSHQGMGLRSYVDYKIKGGIYIAGGYELNYRNMIRSISELQNYSAWQKSGLIGLSKKYKAGKKLKGNVQLLWDFLSYSQAPRAQAIVFRVGYNIK
jgi:hypothetical protein